MQMRVKVRKSCSVVCEACGREHGGGGNFPYESAYLARCGARDAGWRIVQGRTICPPCNNGKPK